MEKLERSQYQDFEVWHGAESEYADFKTLKETDSLLLKNEDDFWCIGRNIEKADFDQIDMAEFIYQTIRQLLPLYEACHQ